MTPTEALLQYLDRRGLALDRRYLRDGLRTIAQALMESEVGQMLDAARYERNEARRAYRNGYRQSAWATPVGDITLRIPKLRKGSYYPHFLDSEAAAALVRLLETAFVEGVRDLGPALAELDTLLLAPYDVADIAERLDDAVYNARHSALNDRYPVLFLDVLPVEIEGEVRRLPRQILIALGIQPDGTFDLLAHDIVTGLDDRMWARLLRQLKQRGLHNVDEVVSAGYEGLRAAVETEMVDAVWHHHRHFLSRERHNPLVDAVSDLVIRAESDDRNNPRMQLPVYEADFYPVYIVA